MKKKISMRLLIFFQAIIVPTMLFILSLGIVVPNNATLFHVKAQHNEDVYIVSGNKDYYYETTYYRTKAAYNTHISKIKSTEKKRTLLTAFNSQSDEKEFICVASKRVWFIENINENGIVTESRLLKKNEVEQIKNNSSVYANSGDDTPMPRHPLIGGDAESAYYLDIDLYVYYNTIAHQYEVQACATWEAILVFPWQGSSGAAEENHDDFIAVTWGGNGELCGTYDNIVGTYYNNTAVTFIKDTSNSYSGFTWRFREKSGFLGKELESAIASISLNYVGDFDEKETNVKMTYIHTYGEIGGSVTFGVNSQGYAASVNLSQTTQQWKVEVDVHGIEY